jgi:hypothetical protein
MQFIEDYPITNLKPADYNPCMIAEREGYNAEQ